jgi:predicted small secreted protein
MNKFNKIKHIISNLFLDSGKILVSPIDIEETIMKSIYSILFAVVITAGLLTGCNTVRGVGKDIQAVGTPDNSKQQVTTTRTTVVHTNN